MARLPFLALAVALLPSQAEAQTRDDLVRTFILCVRRAAEVLEPSDDPPSDVAAAAVILCHREETDVISADRTAATGIRSTALFYGAGQVTAARACRKARRCGLLPIPN